MRITEAIFLNSNFFPVCLVRSDIKHNENPVKTITVSAKVREIIRFWIKSSVGMSVQPD